MNGKRVLAGFIDLIIACIIQFILMVFCIIIPVFIRAEVLNIAVVLNLVITFVTINYMLLRDLIGGRSIGKRLVGLKVIDKQTGEPAGLLKCLLRNVTWFIGSIDIIVYLIKGARLGDMLAGTDVVEKGSNM